MPEKVSTTDLYHLRHAHLAAQRAALMAQQAEQAFRELVLELEQRYGLLGTTSTIDVHTGDVQTSLPNGQQGPETAEPSPDETPSGGEPPAQPHSGQGVGKTQ